VVVPTSQRTRAICWSSHKDHVAKALKKLAGPHLPASLSQLEKAVQRAHREYATAATHAHRQAERERAATSGPDAVTNEDDVAASETQAA